MDMYYTKEWWQYEYALRGAKRRVNRHGEKQQLEHKLSDCPIGDRGESIDFATRKQAMDYARKNNINVIEARHG